MSEMVDRAVVAMQKVSLERTGKWIPKHLVHHFAAAVMEAMREPTVEMLIAAQEEWMCVRAAEERGDFIWRAMCDEALK